MRTQRIVFGSAAATAIVAALFFGAPARANTVAETNATPSAAPAAPGLPSGAAEVLKLVKAGVPNEVVVNYVNNSGLTFYLNADNLIYLQQQGVSAQIITTLLHRNGEMQRDAALAYQRQQAATPQSTAVVENPTDNFNSALNARASAYTVTPPATAYYSYAAPTVGYPVYYPSYYSYGYYPYSYSYPTFSVGFGFGRFGGSHFGGGHFGGGHFAGGGHFGGGHFSGGSHVGGGGHFGGHR